MGEEKVVAVENCRINYGQLVNLAGIRKEKFVAGSRVIDAERSRREQTNRESAFQTGEGFLAYLVELNPFPVRKPMIPTRCDNGRSVRRCAVHADDSDGNDSGLPDFRVGEQSLVVVRKRPKEGSGLCCKFGK